MRSLTYYVASTLDGFICGPDGSYDFFPFAPDTQEFTTTEYPETLPTVVRINLGINDAENRHFDSILQGSGSYQIALDAGLTSPYAHARQYVFSSKLPEDTDPSVTVVREDPCEYVRRLKDEPSPLGLCLLGGSAIAGALLPVIDEVVIKRYPVLAGSGLPMFKTGFDPHSFERVWSHSFDSGADYSLFRRRSTDPPN